MNHAPFNYAGFLLMLVIGVALFFVAAGTISAALEVGGTVYQTGKKDTRVSFALVTLALLAMVGCACMN